MDFFEKHHRIILSIILVLMFSLGVWSMSKDSLTIDETAHLPAGYLYVSGGDYRFNPEHPPLVKMLSGTAISFLDPTFEKGNSWEDADQWEFGRRFFFLYNIDKQEHLVFWGRMPVLLLGVLLCFVVYLFARDLYGIRAGLLAAFFTALSPNILAHSRYVTTDMGVTFFFFLSVYLFWKCLGEVQGKHALRYSILLGIAVGGVIAAKFSGLFILPTLCLLLLVWYFVDDKKFALLSWKTKAKELPVLLRYGSITVLVALFFILLCYQFTHIDAFFAGLAHVSEHSALGHASYLLGEYSFTGWWYYFPVALFFKTPLITFALLLAVVVFLFWKKIPPVSWKNELFLIIPFALYLAAFMINHINIGLRHILPVYPFLFVFISKITLVKVQANLQKWLHFGIGVALVCYVITHALIMPHYLAYFNVAAGGPVGGKDILIDSNLDWGQDVKKVAAYLHEHNIEEVNIKFFGHEPIEVHGITAKELGCTPLSGIAVISVNALIGLEEYYSHCYAWLREKEPIATPGYSAYIYNITDVDAFTEKQALCEQGCRQRCGDQYLIFRNSTLDPSTNKCSCGCEKLN